MIENVANRIAQPADGLVVDVTSDLICPWCFVAKRRLEKAALILGKTLEIRWHPFQLNAETKPIRRHSQSCQVGRDFRD
jgi:predicted DsbA family dithiol-disulfide isomerase